MRPRRSCMLVAIGLSTALASPPQILVYSRTVGYRHESIPVAIASLTTIAQNTSLYNPTFSEDPSLFTPEQLAPFAAVVFLSNSDEVLDADGQAALETYLEGGGGLIGLHAATACLFEDLAFGVGMGSWFDRHPTISNATFLKVVDHETVDMLPDEYNYVEEVYSFRSDPRAVNATVILTVDNTSYVDDAGVSPYFQGSPHPIAWYREPGQVDLGNGTRNGTMTGPMWYTSLGHTNDTWRNSIHLAHVQAGIQWTLERVTVNTTTSPTTSGSSSSLSSSHTSTSHTSTSHTSTSTGAAASPTSSKISASSSRSPMVELLLGTVILALTVIA